MEVAQCLLLLLTIQCACAQDVCEFPIRRNRVLSAWQSSTFDKNYCFFKRNQYVEETELNDKTVSYRFFHSSDKFRADGGFHWFAVQLNESVLISSVTVKGREDSASFVYARVQNIEIWTSNRREPVFSGDHCNSTTMSRQFNESFEHWTLCGITKSKGPKVAQGEILKVTCLAKVRQLLLRRDIREANASSSHDLMSFADLKLNKLQLVTSKPQLVAEKSNFDVGCTLNCVGTDMIANFSELQLCLPNGSCVSNHRLHVASAQPLHSGAYTCKLRLAESSTLVTVLSSSPDQVVAENSSFSVNCSLHCGDENNCTGNLDQDIRPQLCLPNGSCIATTGGLVAMAQPRLSGIYTCRAGLVSKNAKVAMLSSSPDQNVAENSSFTVSCTLHCNSSDLSAVLRKLMLCPPVGSCISNYTFGVSRAKRGHSGTYTCRLGSAESHTTVSVLYPPLSVSISMISSVSCKSNSEVILQFKSSASQPFPEHSCDADVGGVGMKPMLFLSQRPRGNGSVSRWKLVNVEEPRLLKENDSLIVNCVAKQTLPTGISFMASHVATQQWMCTSTELPIMVQHLTKFVALSLASTFIAALIVCTVVWLAISLRQHDKHRTPAEAVELNSFQLNSGNGEPNSGNQAAVTHNEERPVETQVETSVQEPESDCNYLSVKPAGAESAEHPDDRSDSTDFICIVADGD